MTFNWLLSPALAGFACDVGSCFDSTSHTQFGEDLSDVVLSGLGADEGPPTDVGFVRPCARRSNLYFSPGELAPSLWACLGGAPRERAAAETLSTLLSAS